MGPFLTLMLARRILASPRVRAKVQAAVARWRDLDPVEGDPVITVAVAADLVADEPLEDVELALPLVVAGRSRRDGMLGALAVFIGLSVAAWIGGLLMARKLTSGDESSDDFQVAVIMGGKVFQSYAGRLRSATAITVLGGMTVDLREATLDPAGARLELKTTMAGIEVRVPDHWSVQVDQQSDGTQLEVDLPSPESLPQDAPRLHIRAVTRMGGGLVSARKD